jgi:hypothetical protein
MKVMLTYFHELVSPHSVSFVAELSFCLYRVTDEKPLTLYLTYCLSDLNK